MSSAVDVQLLLERGSTQVCDALCTVAQVSLCSHNTRQAFETLRTIRRILGEISGLTGEPGQLSFRTSNELTGLLSELGAGLQRYELLIAALPAMLAGRCRCRDKGRPDDARSNSADPRRGEREDSPASGGV